MPAGGGPAGRGSRDGLPTTRTRDGRAVHHPLPLPLVQREELFLNAAALRTVLNGRRTNARPPLPRALVDRPRETEASVACFEIPRRVFGRRVEHAECSGDKRD